MSKYSLKETLLGEKKASKTPRKLTASELRGMIMSESRRRLFEQDEEAGGPKGTKFTDQSNFKDFDDEMIYELFAQIKTKDMSQPIFSAMYKPDPEKTAAWLEEKGEDTVRERIKAVGEKIPSEGIPKKDMPFLPGPPDATGKVEDVVDALTPGGKVTIDFQESRRSRDPLLERWGKLAGVPLLGEVAPPAPNELAPGSPETKEYLESGLEPNDGNADDDNANVKAGAEIPAGKAIPTQSNILLPKALGMAVNGVEGGDLGAYFSTKGEILDGHHRWAATMLNNPGASMGGFAAIDLDALGGREQALKHLTALGNALGNKTKTA
jgi:hypothetical protein